jgi:hypothetical protein
MKEIEPLFAAGGDAAERKFMECCWCLWKAGGAELVEPFVEAIFNNLPDKSRSVLFQRLLTIVYVAPAAAPTRRSRHHRSPRPPELHRRPDPESLKWNRRRRPAAAAPPSRLERVGLVAELDVAARPRARV